MKRMLVLLAQIVTVFGACGCALLHGDPNDFERGSGGVGVLSPQLKPASDAASSTRPVLPLSGSGAGVRPDN